MTVFIASAALLTLLVLAWLVWALLRSSAPGGVSSQRLNAAIYRDQLQTLEQDLARGAISAADYEATRDELQLRLLDDTGDATPAAQPGSASFWSPRRTAAVVALLLPLGSAGMYWWLGAPRAVDPVAAAHMDQEQVVKMVEALAARLKANPDNPTGWAMLGRSYKAMGRMEEAEQAYARVGPLLQTDPDMLVHYADLLAVRAGGSLQGKPLQMIKQALSLDPQHPMALMLAATAAYQQGQFAGAVLHWEKLLTLLEPGSQDAELIQSYVDDARAKAGMKPASAASKQAAKASPAVAANHGANVSGVVSVDAALKAKVSPEDVVMVIARVPGNRMPVAVLRKQANELPLKFTLDDSLSMSPQARISTATEVEIEARISKSGMAQAEAGDLISAVQTVKVGAQGLTLRVAKVRP
jgi:cytochrome c-type biogenesis protein CcmH